MGKICEICGKGQMSGHNVSHSKHRTKRTWKPNIIKTKIGSGRQMTVCSRCLKGLTSARRKKTAQST